MNSKIVCLLIFLLFIGCGPKKKNSIATVEGDSLSKEKLKKIIPESTNLSSMDRDHLKSIISDWVQSEILYREAEKNHFHKDETIKYKAEKYFKTLVTEEYLNYYLNSNPTIPEEKIRKYYHNNKESFKRNSETVLVKHFFNKDYEIAKNIKIILVSDDQSKIEELLKNKDYDVQYIESGNCIPKFEEMIFKGRNKQIYGPIVTDFGYHVIKVENRFEDGSIKKFSEVRDEITKKLLQKENHTKYRNLLDSLKNKYYWKINDKKLESIIGES